MTWEWQEEEEWQNENKIPNPRSDILYIDWAEEYLRESIKSNSGSEKGRGVNNSNFR
jgi:hypothetical protein